MEVAGIVLAAAGIAIQLGELGIEISSGIKSIIASQEELQSLCVKILHESEQSKLLGFVLFDKGKYGLDGNLFESLDRTNQEVLYSILQRLFSIWIEVRDFAITTFNQDRFPAAASTSGQRSRRLFGMGMFKTHAEAGRLRRQLETAIEWNQLLERRLLCLNLLQDSSRPLHVTLDRLHSVSQDTHAKALGWDSLARLRLLVIGSENPSVDFSMLPIPNDIQLEDNRVSGLMTIRQNLLRGVMGREQVLVETLTYDTHARPALSNRVKELVSFLKTEKSENFRVPRAQGFYEDSRRRMFGIVFDMRYLNRSLHLEVLTLRAIFEQSRHQQQKSGSQVLGRPPLEEKFRLAYSLAVALSKFQSVGWFHQNIRSENVVFAAAAPIASNISYSDPWLFEYSTSRSIAAVSANLFDSSPIQNIYRHPDRWYTDPRTKIRFSSIHDIYSLGVLLLEISVWSPVETLVQPKAISKDAKASEVQVELVQLARHSNVQELMGRRFAAIIEMCLQGHSSAFGVKPEDGDQSELVLQLEFLERVVKVLRNLVDTFKSDSID